MDCGKRFRDIRLGMQLSQWQAASLIHVDASTFSDYETGRIRITLDSILLYAKKMNLSVDYVTGVSDRADRYPER